VDEEAYLGDEDDLEILDARQRVFEESVGDAEASVGASEHHNGLTHGEGEDGN
jgi:hypothetical protein